MLDAGSGSAILQTRIGAAVHFLGLEVIIGNMTPDEMIQRLLSNADPDELGRLANDLLGEFGRGYPIENLGRIFPADKGLAAFLATELGARARPFIREIAE